MKNKLTKIFLLLMLGSATLAKAQGTQPDTLPGTVARLASEIEALKRIKITGYIQAQFQYADSSGMNSYGGGAFPSHTDKRFQVRRGRLKSTYTSANTLTQAVLQLDVTERGLTIKDAYIRVTEPWCKWVSLKVGMFDRPFGFDIGYSSSLRESPERGRMSQIIFPNERDLGADLILQGPKGGNWEWLKLEGGMFNGTGAPSAAGSSATAVSNTSDFDKFKDFIGRISASRATINQKIKYGIGASIYEGGFRTDNDTIFSGGDDGQGVRGYRVSDENAKRSYVKRSYVGGDAQITIEWAAGLTTLRGEYIMGKQPGTSSSSSTSPAAAVTTNVYKREFNGAYFYFVHNIVSTPLQLIAKYDWDDPNTDAKGDELGKKMTTGKSFGVGDVRYDTYGFGLAYLWDANVKITLYYDYIMNEKSANLAGYEKDLDDNLFTARVQYKF